VVLKVANIDPQGPIGPSNGLLNSHGVHRMAAKFLAYFQIVYYFIMHFKQKVLKFIMTHTFLILVTVGLGHGVYRKLYTLNRGQRAETFENH